jgi:hypothetical protein
VFGEEADRAKGDELARMIARGLSGRQSRWYTTQEIVWGVTGLGKHLKSSATAFGPSQLMHNTTQITGEAVAKNLPDQRWRISRASEYDQLTLSPPSEINGDLYLFIESSGVRPDTPWTFGGESLAVSRRYVDGEGQGLDPKSLELGDMVYSIVTLKNTTSETIQNIALVDRIPAGWEIENPRLGRSQQFEWMYDLSVWEAEHMNLRDDRVEVFGTLGAGESRDIVVGVRAVTAGSFTIPPVEVEAMYDPSIWARAPGDVTTIDGAWDAYFL